MRASKDFAVELDRIRDLVGVADWRRSCDGHPHDRAYALSEIRRAKERLESAVTLLGVEPVDVAALIQRGRTR